MIPDNLLDEDTPEIKRRQRYINKSKETAWKRKENGYLRSLWEKHNMLHNTKEIKIEVRDVVLIKGEEKKKRKWNIRIEEELYKGKTMSYAVSGYEHQSHIERPIQHLYPNRASRRYGKINK